MGWIGCGGNVALIAGLYRFAGQVAVGDFRRSALQRLAARFQFDGAWWTTRRLDNGAVLGLSTYVCRQGSVAPAAAPEAAALELLGVPAATHGICTALALTELEPPVAERLARPHGITQLFICAQAHADTQLQSILLLYRTTGGAAFGYEESDALSRLLPHALHAEQLAVEAHVTTDLILRSSGRPSRGEICVCYRDGSIRAISPGFVEVLRAQYPAAEFSRLPFPLPAGLELDSAGSRGRNLNAGGLQLRVNSVDGLLLLHLRAKHPFDELSPREQDIARAMVRGESYKFLARKLGLAASTVANHASNIYRKLGVFSREEVRQLAQQARKKDGNPAAAGSAGQ